MPGILAVTVRWTEVIVQSSRIGLRQRGGQEIGLLLIVALDGDAVARGDDCFKQVGRTVGRTELSAADLCGPRQPGSAIRSLS